MLIIRDLQRNEIEKVRNFPPEEWQLNIVDFLKNNYQYPFFQTIVAELDGELAGIGNIFIHEKTAWLGNIIVQQNFRGNGMGTAITEKLINIGKHNNCESILLTATELGEKIYRKLGFKVSSYYEFYRNGKVNCDVISKNIISNSLEYNSLEKIDEKVTGEKRSAFLKNYFNKNFLYRNSDTKEVEGFYLPTCGKGLIIAGNDAAGIELLKIKCKEDGFTIVIPEQNESARKFLLENRYELYRKAPRMYLGSERNWKPELVFSRGSGYAG